MAERPKCRFYNTGQGCKHGDRCRFLHDRNGISGASPVRNTRSPSVSASVARPVHNGAPRQACNFFWSTGSCNRGFECSFKHVRGPGAAGEDSAASSSLADSDAADFFSIEGLARSSGAIREQPQNLNPSEAHNHIKPFLWDNYRFENAARVQGFVRVIASVNDRNKAWNTDNAQAFLDFIVKGNGIIRIGEVLRFQPVDSSTEYGSGTLSFQRGYFPVFEYLGSDLVLKSTWHKNINHLYTVFEENYDDIHNVLRTCMSSIIARKSWRDPSLYVESHQSNLDGVVVFKTLSTVLLQYINRFKDAIRNHPDIAVLVQDLTSWFDTWANDVSAHPPRFDDGIATSAPNVRILVIGQIREDINRLHTIVQRESDHAAGIERRIAHPTLTEAQLRQAAIIRFAQTYDPPGELRPEGPRHNNDFANISQIRIAPTHEELFSAHSHYLPIFLAEAPHHLPADSMERHLDIQFRLLREELVAPIRTSLNAIFDNLVIMWNSRGQKRELTKLEELLAKRGGAYKTSGYDSVFFFVYTNVYFAPVKAERRDLTVGLLLDAPAGAARDSNKEKRFAYWEHSKRLQSGSLVALALVTHRSLKVFLGVVASYGKDIAESSKASDEQVQVRVTFFDPEIEMRALKREKLTQDASTYAFLVDNSIMFESVRPFLEKLQTIEPTEIPFARYISHTGSLKDVQMLPPMYARFPNFRYKLQSLAKHYGDQINDLDIWQPNAVDTARRQLLQSSTLDPSQVDALINTLTREVSLIQGPPGTGKSYIGREILRVLFASRVRPIVLIAYTNHALDHMLSMVLDAGITNKLVRLGSRSSDERISEFTLDKLEKVDAQKSLDRSVSRQYAKMKKLEEEMVKVMESIQLPILSWDNIQEFLNIHYPEHADALLNPPYWIYQLTENIWADEDANGEWSTAGRKSKQPAVENLSRTFYGFWKSGTDIDFISPPHPPTQMKRNGKRQTEQPTVNVQENPVVTDFFVKLGYGDQRPPVPNTQRSIAELLNNYTVWSMSLPERARLAEEWERTIRVMAYEANLNRYNDLRTTYKEACKEYNDIRDETRRRLLNRMDLIGCTTTGAAKLTSLISSIAPRALMVEEAGQVLEAHILTSLVPSVHHLICIGDPQQLRPTLATFALSMDSERGKELFKFDRSLMERLADMGLPMTQINVQRRMKPSISHFIREILYPKLEDHDVVKEYPPVQGMQKDVYFLDHTNPEGGLEDSVSKYNMYEVQMIRDLVLYFLRQEKYSGPGDIAVLCAYLGQLQKVRQALRDLKIAVAVDERDQEQLARQGIDDDVILEQVLVAKHIRLGTVDIFQGQEAKIVIVSLVRNTGTFETDSASIGFLKSSNRINVALSRAKHGLYILGNASNLRKNRTWTTIVDTLRARDQIGQGLPVVCPRHPEQAQTVSKPGELNRYAPQGGCLLPCGFQLPCGHICPSVCHAVLDNHRSMRCNMPCNRTPCPHGHPCSRRCSDDCGDCEFPIYGVELPCNHIKDRIPCHLLGKLDEVKCTEEVEKRLPRCEHSAIVSCHRDPATVECKKQCGGTMECCSKTCKSRCSECQKVTAGPGIIGTTVSINRTKHKKHPCERPLYCLHNCGLNCHPKDEGCNPSCQQRCRQECRHQRCEKPCSTPCAPCMEPCIWTCKHQSCPVTCGSICTRLPCDEPCQNDLTCGHPCPSVCGEECDTQECVVCLPSNRKQQIVDFIMQRSLEEIDLTSADVADRLITLSCGHIFTVETLDGHCSMSEFYEMDAMGRFLSTKEPPIDYQTPPTCPTCRGPITALRYGRVTKRATLDILEQNVANTMRRSLNDINPACEALSASFESCKEAAKKISSDANNTSPIASKRAAAAVGKANEPLSYSFLHRGAMHSTHGFSATEAKAWNDVIKDLLSLYSRVEKIANTRGAHVKAYEGALTTLYRLELDTIINDSSQVSGTPEHLAIKTARKKVGQPPPKADSRFQIEAYFRTLDLRFMLAEIGFSRIEALPMMGREGADAKHRNLWASFIEFLYDSCVADSEKALYIAKESSASRQAVRCVVYIMRSAFERFRFKMLYKIKTGGPEDGADRNELAKEVTTTQAEMKMQLAASKTEYIRSQPIKDMHELREERQWFEDNCGRKVERFIEELDNLEEFVRLGAHYQPLSLNEKEDIVKALGFGTSGHFYNCENGHPFVITECGGAMQTARCPECGAPIGGSSHRLLDSNRVATDFEDILRRRPGLIQGFY